MDDHHGLGFAGLWLKLRFRDAHPKGETGRASRRRAGPRETGSLPGPLLYGPTLSLVIRVPQLPRLARVPLQVPNGLAGVSTR